MVESCHGVFWMGLQVVWYMPKGLEAFDTSQDRKTENVPLVSGAGCLE